jgi:RNA polymerase sigma factor (sigma-70 family)
MTALDTVVPATADPVPIDFEPWYGTERPRVVGAMYVRCRDRELASEIADEAFVRALVRWPDVAAMQSPGGWVHKVAVNILRRIMRRRAMEARYLQIHCAVDSCFNEGQDVWDAVRLLAPRQRTAVVLRFVTDLPEADIATAMGVTRGTVSSTLAVARARLAFLLSEKAG